MLCHAQRDIQGKEQEQKNSNQRHFSSEEQRLESHRNWIKV